MHLMKQQRLRLTARRSSPREPCWHSLQQPWRRQELVSGARFSYFPPQNKTLPLPTFSDEHCSASSLLNSANALVRLTPSARVTRWKKASFLTAIKLSTGTADRIGTIAATVGGARSRATLPRIGAHTMPLRQLMRQAMSRNLAGTGSPNSPKPSRNCYRPRKRAQQETLCPFHLLMLGLKSGSSPKATDARSPTIFLHRISKSEKTPSPQVWF